MGKKVYLKGKAHYIRPYFLDTGENLEEGSDIKEKLMKTGGIYSTMVELPFDNRDDAEEHLNAVGIPTNGMFGNLLKKIEVDGEKKIVYKVVRPHMVPAFDDPVQGPPKVWTNDIAKDENGNQVLNDWGKPVLQEWDPSVLIGNGSEITVKLDVWKGTKATKITWEGVRIDSLVEYEVPESDLEGVGF